MRKRYCKTKTAKISGEDEMYDMYDINLYPESGVVNTTARERALGWVLNTCIVHEPGNVSQCDLASDIFFSNFQPDPKIKETVLPSREVNKILLEWAMRQDGFEQGRRLNTGGIAPSMAATSMLWEVLVMEESLQEALKKQEEAEQLENEALQQIQNMAKDKGLSNAQREKAMKEAQEKMDKAKDAANAAKESIEELQKDMLGQGMMASATEKAAEEGEKVDAMMKAWGIEQGTEDDNVDINEIIQAVKAQDNIINEVTKLFGRLKKLTADVTEKARRAFTGAVTEMAYTRDILHIVPSERIRLSSKAPLPMRISAIKQYADQGLLGYAPKAVAHGGGSFVAEIDGSGSMCGEPEVAAKGLALGIARSLQEDKIEKRSYALTTFGSDRDPTITVTDKDDWKQHLDWARKAPYGGTSFDLALRNAMGHIEKMQKAGVLGADVVLITDGECGLSSKVKEEWLTFKEKIKARLFYIELGGGWHYGKKSEDFYNAKMRDLADWSFHIPELTKEVAAELTEKIARSIAEAQMKQE